MGIKSILKKASIGLGSLLLGCNMGCNSVNSFQTDIGQRMPTDLEDEVSSERPKLKKWQYPVNVVGGYLTHVFVHEGGHAVAGLVCGTEIEEFHPYPVIINDELLGGYVQFSKERYTELSPEKQALIDIAGPAADVALAEIINYNLRNGNISPEYQPFWATTSLMARAGPIWLAIGVFSEKKINDFKSFEEDSGVSKEVLVCLTALYTALNAKRIKKELNVALGKDTYPVNTRNSRIDLVPYNNGLGVSYTLKF